MKRIAKLVLAAILSAQPSALHAMTIEQMKELRGADMLELRVDETFVKCGLPDAIVDNGENSSIKNKIQWSGIKMELSDDNWNLLFNNSRVSESENPENGWINPNPEKSQCFSGSSPAVLYTKGRAGILKIDKKKHKTTFKIPDNPYKAHKVIGSKVSFLTPLSLQEIIKKYGKDYDIAENHKGRKIIRYWVFVEANLMPVVLYAVDFEIDKVDDTSVTYTISTSANDFVREKFDMFMRAWERWGID